MKPKQIIAYLLVLLTVTAAIYSKERASDATVLQSKSSLLLGVDGNYSNPHKNKVHWRNDIDFETPPINLLKGEYTLNLQYSAGMEGNIAELAGLSSGTPDNGPLMVYESFTLPANKLESGATENFSYTFTLPEDVLNFSVLIRHAGGPLFIESYTITTQNAVYSDAVFLSASILVLGLLILLYLVKRKKHPALKKPDGDGISFELGFIMSVAAAFYVSLFILLPYISSLHDIWFHMARIDGFAYAIKGGHFPVRINPVFLNGMGDLSATMYPGLFMYVPALLRIIGLSPLAAFEVWVLLINLATAIICYVTMQKLFCSRFMGTTVSIFYTFALYRLLDLFTRGAMGEFLAMIFLPCIILGVHELFWAEKPSAKWLAIGFWGVFNSHMLFTLVCVSACVVYGLFHLKKLFTKARIIALVKAAAAVCLLSAWTLVPFLMYSRMDLFLYKIPADLQEYTMPLRDLFISFITPFKKISLSIGAIMGIGIIVYLFGKYVFKQPFFKDNEKLSRIGSACLSGGLLFIFISSELFPWDMIMANPVLAPAIKSLQFPWRLLAFATILLAVVAALAVYRFYTPGKKGYVMLLCCFFAAAVFSSPYLSSSLKPELVAISNKYDTTMYSYNMYENLYLVIEDEDHNSYVSRLMHMPPNIQTTYQVEISEFKRKPAGLSFSYKLSGNVEDDVTAQLPIYYYPGYTAVDENGTRMEIGMNEDHLMLLSLPAEKAEGSVNVYYKERGLFILADIVSLLSYTGLIAFTIFKAIRKKRGGQA